MTYTARYRESPHLTGAWHRDAVPGTGPDGYQRKLVRNPPEQARIDQAVLTDMYRLGARLPAQQVPE